MDWTYPRYLAMRKGKASSRPHQFAEDGPAQEKT